MPNRKTNKRGAQGSGTIRQRPDGRWEARFTTGRNPGTGKQIQKSIYGDTQQEVRKKLSATIKEIDDKTYKEPSILSLGEWLDEWLRKYIGNVKDATRRAYTDHVMLQIKPRLGAYKLHDLNGETIQDFYDELTKSGRRLQKGQKKEAPPGLSAKTIRNIHAVLRKALEQAVSLSYINSNPTKACILPRVEKKDMVILQGEEIPAFINAVDDHRHKNIYLFALFTGARRAEILGLEWECIDFIGKTILLRKQLQRERVKGGSLRLVALKNDKQRRITPPDTIFRLLGEQRRKQTERKQAVGQLWHKSGLVFTNEIGEPLDADAVYKAYKKLLSDNGLPDIRFHDLRHTAATLMIENGDCIKSVSESLGHHSAGFTLDTYSHVTDRMRRDSADRMEAMIQSIKKSG
jgi:integrase